MKFSKKILLSAFLTIFTANITIAQSLGDLFGGKGSDILSSVIEGVFSSSDITLKDMQGNWQSTGAAVCFQGEGFLKKAGGIAAAAAIESKLNPYYEQYGLNNATLEIDTAGNFTLKAKQIKLSGTITRDEKKDKGIFEFNFTAMGRIRLGTVTTYVEKSSKTMDVMFDATKLKKLLSAISQFSGMTTLQTLNSILESYDGLCIGFHLVPAGTNMQNASSAAASSDKGKGKSDKKNNDTGKDKKTSTGKDKTQEDPISRGLDLLRDILNNRGK